MSGVEFLSWGWEAEDTDELGDYGGSAESGRRFCGSPAENKTYTVTLENTVVCI